MAKLKDKIRDALAGRSRKCKICPKTGGEILDPVPLNLPTGLKRPQTQEEKFRAMIAHHNRQMATDVDYAEENDFDIDEPDILTMAEQEGRVLQMADVQVEKQPQVETTSKKAEPTQPQVAPSPTPAKTAEVKTED